MLPELRVRLISDGDLAAGIFAAVAGTNIHALMEIGGAPEGRYHSGRHEVLNGEIQGRLVFDPKKLGVDASKIPERDKVLQRWSKMGITDPNEVYHTSDLLRAREFCLLPKV